MGLKNKIGSIIALNPQTGEIITMLSSPSFNPNIFLNKKKKKIIKLRNIYC